MLDKMRTTYDIKTSKISYKEALCTNERYAKATWIGTAVLASHALSMPGTIHQYSNRLLKEILSSDSWATPRIGSILFDVCNISGGFFFILSIRLLGRKSLLVIGHIFIAFCFIFVALFTRIDKPMLAFYTILLFYLGYPALIGTVEGIYVLEISCDTGFIFGRII